MCIRDSCYPILPNRLAFPEHIPNNWYANFFYNSDTAFYQLLKEVIVNFDKIKKPPLQSFVKHYDWRNLAPLYDATFDRLALKY